MKSLTKLITNAIIIVLLCVSCLGLVGCKKDIKTIELTIALYDYENDTMFEESEVAITIDLYRHLAPKTVDKMVEYVKAGYYDDTIFYKLKDSSKQIMLGDLKFDGEKIVQNEIKPQLYGEFENNGTKGSNLVNKKGSIGLWRTWTANDDKYGDDYKTNSSTDTGRATWFMPTTNASSYDGWFCVFGMLNLDDESTNKGINGIIDAFSSAGIYEEYVVYYTGEYQDGKENENYGLTFHCVPERDFDEDKVEGLFKAEGAQHSCYNYYTIQVPLTEAGGSISAKVVSAKVI